MRKFLFSFICFFCFQAFCQKATNFSIVTIPKAGTHLLRKYAILINQISPQKIQWPRNTYHLSADYITGNFRPLPFRATQGKVLSILRDPRDILVSNVFHRDTDKVLKGDEKLSSMWKKLTFDEKLMLLINPYPPFKDSHFLWVSNIKHMEDMLELMNLPNVYTCRFEHLVGAQGGGDKKLQIKEFLALANFLGFNLNNKEIDYLCKNLFGNAVKKSYSFRTGKIGQWKNYFKQEHIEAFKQNLNHFLIAFDYEEDDRW